MNHKKEILKKYTGKGGIVSDTIKEIPNTIGKIGNAYKNVKNKVQSGMTKGIVNFVGKTPAGNILKSGLQEQRKAKLQNMIKPTPIEAPKLMPAKTIKKATPIKPKGINGPKEMNNILKARPKPVKEPWMEKDYKPGSIKRGYTKYA